MTHSLISKTDKLLLRRWVKIATPGAIRGLAQLGPGLVGLIFIGRLGTDELASVSMAQIWMFAFSMFVWLGMSNTMAALISQAHGARNGIAVHGWTWIGLISSLAVAAVVAVFWGVTKYVLIAIGASDPAHAEMAQAYAFACMPFLLFTTLITVLETFLVSIQRPLPALIAEIIAGALEIAGYIILVNGVPSLGFNGLGVQGAGIALSVAGGCGLVAYIIATFWNTCTTHRWKKLVDQDDVTATGKQSATVVSNETKATAGFQSQSRAVTYTAGSVTDILLNGAHHPPNDDDNNRLVVRSQHGHGEGLDNKPIIDTSDIIVRARRNTATSVTSTHSHRSHRSQRTHYSHRSHTHGLGAHLQQPQQQHPHHYLHAPSIVPTIPLTGGSSRLVTASTHAAHAASPSHAALSPSRLSIPSPSRNDTRVPLLMGVPSSPPAPLQGRATSSGSGFVSYGTISDHSTSKLGALLIPINRPTMGHKWSQLSSNEGHSTETIRVLPAKDAEQDEAEAAIVAAVVNAKDEDEDVEYDYMSTSSLFYTKDEWKGIVAFVCNPTNWREYWSLAVGNLVTVAVEQWQLQLVSFLAARMGSVDIAAHNAMLTMFDAVSTALYGMGEATSVCVAFFLGQGSPKLARRMAYLSIFVAFLWSLVLSALMLGCRQYIGRMFSDDPEVWDLCAVLALFAAGSYAMLSICHMTASTLDGQARGTMLAVCFLTGSWGVTVPAAFLMNHFTNLGLMGLWTAFTLGYSVATVFCSFAVLRSDWNQLAIDAQKRSEAAKADADAADDDVDAEAEITNEEAAAATATLTDGTVATNSSTSVTDAVVSTSYQNSLAGSNLRFMNGSTATSVSPSNQVEIDSRLSDNEANGLSARVVIDHQEEVGYDATAVIVSTSSTDAIILQETTAATHQTITGAATATTTTVVPATVPESVETNTAASTASADDTV